jgi:uncharacterized protein YdaU (DUF1376 family)
VNYYAHHIGDYARDTAHLTMLEDAAYRRMLDLYYASERPLPLNRAGLYRLVRARSKDERSAVDTVLLEYFVESESGWTNKRCDAEIAKTQGKSDAARQSAHMRWHSERNANALSPHKRAHTDGNAPNNQEPITNNQEPNKEKPARQRATSLPADFGISEGIKAWAASKGHGSLEAHLEFFVGRMRASGKKYLDWDQAFQNCIREDWAGIRAQKSNGKGFAVAHISEPAALTCKGCAKPIFGSAKTMGPAGWMHDACWEAR